jgi:hypothetical protein
MKLILVSSLIIWASVSAAMAQEVRHDVGRNVQPIQNKVGWWTDRDAGLIGGIGGVVCGLLGGLVGSLGGCGKARRFVLAICASSTVFGVVSLVVGVVALTLGQPYGVYYPLLLFGILLPAVMGPMFIVLRIAYQQRELRKMAAMDAR